MSADQKPIPFARPSITKEDRHAVLSVLDGPILTHGPRCSAFEDSFIQTVGGGYAVSTSSCTAALHLFGIAKGFGPGDEIIAPAMSHVATAHAIEVTGARPVFVDCEEDGNIDRTGLEKAVTPATKAIYLVHFLGIPAAMKEIMEIAGRRNLPVLEDCAVGLGSTVNGNHVGLIGDAGCFSFYPAKHITAAEGGMFVTRDKELADSIRQYRGFHYDRTLIERKLPGIYDVTGCGVNYRMSELQAALGGSQLSRLKSVLDSRRRNFEQLSSLLETIDGVSIVRPIRPSDQQSYYTMCVVLDGDRKRRDGMLRFLSDQAIGTSVHYPHPIPRLRYYREKYGYDAAEFPNAERIADRSLDLPVGPHISEDDVARIASVFREALRRT